MARLERPLLPLCEQVPWFKGPEGVETRRLANGMAAMGAGKSSSKQVEQAGLSASKQIRAEGRKIMAR